MINHIRYLLVMIVLLYLGVFSAIYTPKITLINNGVKNLEIAIDDWRFIRDIKMDKKTYEYLAPNSFFFKEYRNNKGHLLHLVVVYHQNDRWGAHDPIGCYKSQGWEIIEGLRSITIRIKNQDFSINKFTAKKDGVISLVYYYWFSSNKKMTASRNKQMFDMVLNNLIHGFAESGFVEISMTLTPFNEDKIVSEMKNFTNKFTQIFEKSL